MFLWQIIRILVTLALEQKSANREKASVLISDLYGQLLNSREVAVGFEQILHQLSDLVLDTPDVTDAVGNFIARAVADDCLAPAFVLKAPGSPIDPKIQYVGNHSWELLGLIVFCCIIFFQCCS